MLSGTPPPTDDLDGCLPSLCQSLWCCVELSECLEVLYNGVDQSGTEVACVKVTKLKVGADLTSRSSVVLLSSIDGAH